MTSKHLHTQTAQEALCLLKQLSANLNGWDLIQEDQSTKHYQKANSSYPHLPIVRSEAFIQGHEFTTEQVASVIALPGCRRVWDEKLGCTEIKTMYHTHEYLFWCRFRANFPRGKKSYHPRDMAGIAVREISNAESFVAMTSVVDDAIPNDAYCVRAHLILSGWRITQMETGIYIVYITQIDLNGHLPNAWLDYTAWYLVKCTSRVVTYIEQHGYPPTIIDCTANSRNEDFNHDTKEYCCTLDGSGHIKWEISGRMYPNNIHISMDGSHGNLHVVAPHPDNHENHVVILRDIDGLINIKITSR